MSRFIKRENLAKQEKRKILTKKAPFDPNANFTNADTSYDLPLLDVAVSRKFSFKDSLVEQEFLQNPNIVDKKEFDRIKNSNLELNDKFDNVSDPLFDLDEARDVVTSTIKNNTTGLNKVTKRLKTTNVNSGNKINRYKN